MRAASLSRILVGVVLAGFAAFALLRPRDEGAPVPPELEAGKHAYVRYGCSACHGTRGVGSANLRGVNRDYPSDEALATWLLHPSRVRPGTRMPDYDGVIAPVDLAELSRFVRALGSAAPR